MGDGLRPDRGRMASDRDRGPTALGARARAGVVSAAQLLRCVRGARRVAGHEAAATGERPVLAPLDLGGGGDRRRSTRRPQERRSSLLAVLLGPGSALLHLGRRSRPAGSNLAVARDLIRPECALPIVAPCPWAESLEQDSLAPDRAAPPRRQGRADPHLPHAAGAQAPRANRLSDVERRPGSSRCERARTRILRRTCRRSPSDEREVLGRVLLGSREKPRLEPPICRPEIPLAATPRARQCVDRTGTT